MTKRNLSLDFEIDEDISEEEHNNDLDDESEHEESAESKRRRLAKQYVSKLGNVLKETAEDTDGAVSEQLKRERMIRTGKGGLDSSCYFSTLDLTTAANRQCHAPGITCLTLSPDQQVAYAGSKDNSVTKWECETGQRTIIKQRWSRSSDIQSHEGELLAISITSDGRYIACGGRDKLIRILDSRVQFGEVQIFSGHKGAISGLAFLDNSYSLFSSSLDGSIKSWQLNDKLCYDTLFGHQDEVQSLDCCSKQRIISGGSDRSLRNWKVDQGSHLVFRGHKGSVDSVKMLDDNTFISGGQDGRLCAWKESSKHPVASVDGAHRSIGGDANWITALATLKSTNIFASGSHDGFVKLWSVTDHGMSCVNDYKIDGFVNGLAISESLLVVGSSKEHRLGRWWNLKSCKEKINFIKYR